MMSTVTEGTMTRKNWLNVVAFLPEDHWEQIPLRLYEEIKDNEFLHHEVRNKDNKRLVIDIRPFCASDDCSNL